MRSHDPAGHALRSIDLSQDVGSRDTFRRSSDENHDWLPQEIMAFVVSSEFHPQFLLMKEWREFRHELSSSMSLTRYLYVYGKDL